MFITSFRQVWFYFCLAYSTFCLLVNWTFLSLVSLSDIVSINELSYWNITVRVITTFITDKKTNVSFEGFRIRYHQSQTSSYQIYCDSSDNASLDLQSCRYSICIGLNLFNVISLNVNPLNIFYDERKYSIVRESGRSGYNNNKQTTLMIKQDIL